MDISAEKMIFGVDPKRRDELINAG